MTNLFLSVDFGTPGAVDTAGTRPYTGTVPQWDNASMFLEGGPSQTQTRVNTPTTVRVRVSNSGNVPIEDVRVDAYVMNPFVGPFQPFNAVRKLTGFASSIGVGSGAANASDPHIITCKISDPVAGDIAWTPTAAELANSTGGHLCLVANTYSPPDGAAVPDTTTFSVVSDPHQGQRNVTLLPAASVNKFKIQIFAPEDGQEFALDFHQLHTRDFGASERWLLRSLDEVVVRGGRRGGPLVLTRPGQPDARLGFTRKWPIGRVAIEGMGELNLRRLITVGRRLGIEGAAKDTTRWTEWDPDRLVIPGRRDGQFIHLDLDRDDEPGSLQAFDIVQRDNSGQVLGGLRVISLHP